MSFVPVFARLHLPQLAIAGLRSGREMRALAVAAVLWTTVGCRGDRSDAARVEVLPVFAASSLSDAFTELEATHEAANPGVDVQMSYAGSQVLRLQIEQGAEAAVYASADPMHMEALEAQGLVEASQVFARNELVVVVPAADPEGIQGFDQLDRVERLVIGAPTVPVGRYTRAMLEAADAKYGSGFADRVRARVVSEESNVRLVRVKVELGEADAAVIYRSDAVGRPGLRVVAVPADINVEARYPVAVLAEHPRAEAARRFVAHLRSAEGAAILRRHGVTPEAP